METCGKLSRRFKTHYFGFSFDAYFFFPFRELATKSRVNLIELLTPAKTVQLYAHVHINLRRLSRLSRRLPSALIKLCRPLHLLREKRFLLRGGKHPSGWTPPLSQKTSKFRYTAHEFSPVGVAHRKTAPRDSDTFAVTRTGKAIRARINAPIDNSGCRIIARTCTWVRRLGQAELVNCLADGAWM